MMLTMQRTASAVRFFVKTFCEKKKIAVAILTYLY